MAALAASRQAAQASGGTISWREDPCTNWTWAGPGPRSSSLGRCSEWLWTSLLLWSMWHREVNTRRLASLMKMYWELNSVSNCRYCKCAPGFVYPDLQLHRKICTCLCRIAITTFQHRSFIKPSTQPHLHLAWNAICIWIMKNAWKCPRNNWEQNTIWPARLHTSMITCYNYPGLIKSTTSWKCYRLLAQSC